MNDSPTTLPPQVRAFVGLRIPPAVLEALTSIQQRLRNKFREASWTRPEAMHLTLHFLGNLMSRNIGDLVRELSAIAKARPSFELQLSHVGSFNDRVLWVGAERGAIELTGLANAICDVAKQFGCHEEERAFNAHITLGRFRERTRGVESALRNFPAPSFSSWKVGTFELIRSELSPKGSRYTTLDSFSLQDEVARR